MINASVCDHGVNDIENYFVFGRGDRQEEGAPQYPSLHSERHAPEVRFFQNPFSGSEDEAEEGKKNDKVADYFAFESYGDNRKQEEEKQNEGVRVEYDENLEFDAMAKISTQKSGGLHFSSARETPLLSSFTGRVDPQEDIKSEGSSLEGEKDNSKGSINKELQGLEQSVFSLEDEEEPERAGNENQSEIPQLEKKSSSSDGKVHMLGNFNLDEVYMSSTNGGI